MGERVRVSNLKFNQLQQLRRKHRRDVDGDEVGGRCCHVEEECQLREIVLDSTYLAKGRGGRRLLGASLIQMQIFLLRKWHFLSFIFDSASVTTSWDVSSVVAMWHFIQRMVFPHFPSHAFSRWRNSSRDQSFFFLPFASLFSGQFVFSRTLPSPPNVLIHQLSPTFKFKVARCRRRRNELVSFQWGN